MITSNTRAFINDMGAKKCNLIGIKDMGIGRGDFTHCRIQC